MPVVKHLLFALAFMAASCVPIKPAPTPSHPAGALAFDLVLCRNAVVDNYCDGPANALFTITPTTTDPARVQLGDGDGYTYVTLIPPTWTNVTIDVAANGFSYHGQTTTAALIATNAAGRHNFLPATATHVDPSVFTLQQLSQIRGAMWPQGLGLPFGPRPGAPDNIIATDFYADYQPADQQKILAFEKAAGYTHVVVGPIVDSDGYHGKYPAHDWRGDFEAFLDVLQAFWDNGQAPIVFIHPDGWTFQQTQALTPLFQSERAQRLMRIVIPSGWEPAKYEWSSCTWALYGAWARQTWPQALIGIHTVADVDAPVGTDALCDDNGKPNGAGWSRVAPNLHFWLVQNGQDGGAYRTGPAAQPTLAFNFAAQFKADGDGATTHSAAWHFAHGIDGWPTGSAWGSGIPLRMINGEDTSYTAFWGSITEADRTAWGDLAVASGAGGYLDGGTVSVH